MSARRWPLAAVAVAVAAVLAGGCGRTAATGAARLTAPAPTTSNPTALAAHPTADAAPPTDTIDDDPAGPSPLAQRMAVPSTPACPAWTMVTLGAVASPLTELSGVALGRRNLGALWTHNDSGDVNRVFVLDEAAHIVTTVTVAGAVAIDWEDIALSTSAKGVPWVWAADTGDNFGFRSRVQLYRFPEPTLGPTPPSTLTVTKVQTITVSYPDGPHDVESLAIDPDTGDAVLVAKALDPSKRSTVYVVPRTKLRAGASVVATIIGTLTGAVNAKVGPTAADVSADGRWLVVKNPSETFLWWRAPGQTLAALLATQPLAPCRFASGPGEAIGFTTDAQHLYTVAEGIGSTLRRNDAG